MFAVGDLHVVEAKEVAACRPAAHVSLSMVHFFPDAELVASQIVAGPWETFVCNIMFTFGYSFSQIIIDDNFFTT